MADLVTSLTNKSKDHNVHFHMELQAVMTNITWLMSINRLNMPDGQCGPPSCYSVTWHKFTYPGLDSIHFVCIAICTFDRSSPFFLTQHYRLLWRWLMTWRVTVLYVVHKKPWSIIGDSSLLPHPDMSSYHRLGREICSICGKSNNR